jgi:hypothetical protein
LELARRPYGGHCGGKVRIRVDNERAVSSARFHETVRRRLVAKNRDVSWLVALEIWASRTDDIWEE